MNTDSPTKRVLRGLFFAAFALTCSLEARSQTLVQYDASALPNQVNSSIPVFSSNPGLTASAITRGAGLVAEASAGSLSSSNWPGAGSAPNNNQYYTLTLAANAGNVIDLRNAVLSFDCQRNNSNGVINAYVYTSADGFTSPVSTTGITNNQLHSVTCAFPNTTMYNNLLTVQIRVYADGATQAQRSLDIMDPATGSGNIQIQGGAVVTSITYLTSTWCGASNVNLSQAIAANVVPGATNYQFHFTNNALGYSYIRTKGNGIPTMPLSWILGLQYGNTYTVSVRAYINGAWRPWGPQCALSLQAAIPTPQLTDCAATNLTLSNSINVTPVAGAQNYQYLVTNIGQPYSVVRQMGSPTTSLPLTWLPGLQYGRTYNVQVKANVGGVWGSYGSVCTFTMQADVPSPEVLSCGLVLTMNQPLTCTAITGATDYEWQFVGPQTYVKRRGSNLTSMYPANITGFVAGTYMVSVKAKVGSAWGIAYGTPCSVTIGSPAVRMEDPQEESTDLVAFSTILYPNPIAPGAVPNVQVNGAADQFVTIQITDLSGKVVATYGVQVETDEYIVTLSGFPELAPGMYLMNVVSGDQLQTSKFIVE